jgi:hypothetical protein
LILSDDFQVRGWKRSLPAAAFIVWVTWSLVSFYLWGAEGVGRAGAIGVASCAFGFLAPTIATATAISRHQDMIIQTVAKHLYDPNFVQFLLRSQSSQLPSELKVKKGPSGVDMNTSEIPKMISEFTQTLSGYVEIQKRNSDRLVFVETFLIGIATIQWGYGDMIITGLLEAL